MRGFKQHRGQKRPRVCETCGATMQPDRKATLVEWERRRFCSIACKTWRRTVSRVIAGETRLHSDGYRLVFCPMLAAPHATWVYEHRLVVERLLGRRLASHEYVHHKNEDKLDNCPENLEVLRQSAHLVHHRNSLAEADVQRLILSGHSAAEIVARGVGGHRLVRIRREMDNAGLLPPRPRLAGEAERTLARRLVTQGIRAGTLTRQPCEVCGAEKTEAHHDDYTKPLNVRWLCTTHHGWTRRRVQVAA